jgi:hypothetical protein
MANAGHDRRRIQDWLGHRSIQAHDAPHAIERGAVKGLLEVGGFARRRESFLGEARLPLRTRLANFSINTLPVLGLTRWMCMREEVRTARHIVQGAPRRSQRCNRRDAAFLCTIH